ncbi:hypothetical protein PAHAL_5G116400 [Panicum hallii]|uniref:Uncharacterized protein n=1 Tax=Panicum hallii TaxID=206008 RepID=A0A2S3HQN5_9POAL|nr:hypothetical protein PAHAL_5G116400 [Panicum hallii]
MSGAGRESRTALPRQNPSTRATFFPLSRLLSAYPLPPSPRSPFLRRRPEPSVPSSPHGSPLEEPGALKKLPAALKKPGRRPLEDHGRAAPRRPGAAVLGKPFLRRSHASALKKQRHRHQEAAPPPSEAAPPPSGRPRAGGPSTKRPINKKPSGAGRI